MNPYDFYITPEEYDIAERNGIANKTLEYRVRVLGWSKERALTEKPEQKRDRRKWAKVAEKNGIPYGTFIARINNYGWTEEKAATIPLGSLRNKKKSKIPAELIEIAESKGIKRSTLYMRIKRGMSPEEAATTPVMTASEAGFKGRRKSREMGYML